jgi:hypothetical protein
LRENIVDKDENVIYSCLQGERDMNIRASMLPGVADCERRAMGSQYRKKFEKLGYVFKQLAPSVGSAIGTAFHHGTGKLFYQKWEGSDPNLDDATEQAIIGFRSEVESGAIWDETTQNVNVAEGQLMNMIREALNGPVKTDMPLTIIVEGKPTPAIEMSLTAKVGEGWTVTGHPDLATVQNALRDWKGGSVNREYFQQIGCYSMLVKANKIMDEVKELYKDFIRRCKKTKLQEPWEAKQYPVAASESAAKGIIKRIISDMQLFDDTGDLDMAFPINRHSMMCSPRYCSCWGTNFCPLSGK